MKDEKNEQSVWNHYRSEIEQVLGKALDEEIWHVLLSLPVAVGPELIWRLKAFHTQLSAAGGTIFFHSIQSHSSPGTQDQVCALCGDPLPQVLTAQSTQRFRCELCAIATRLLLGYPVLYERSRESLPALEH